MDTGIIAAADNTFSFRHELLRRAVGEIIPRPARKALHRQYSQILLGRGEIASLAAGHFLQAAHPDDPASLADLDTAAVQTLRSAPQTAADLVLRALELTPLTDPGALSRAVAATEALTAAGRLDQAVRLAHDTLAKPQPPVAEARLRCALSSVLCARGITSDAVGQAEKVLAQPQLPHGLREEALTAYLQALAGSRDGLAGPLAGTILADPSQHDSHTIMAALAARAVIAWDNGQISEALGLLRDAARYGTGISPMLATPSHCSRSLPPLSTSASSRKPTASSRPPTIRRCTASQPMRDCASCAPASTWPTGVCPTPTPPARRPWPAPRRWELTGTPRPRIAFWL